MAQIQLIPYHIPDHIPDFCIFALKQIEGNVIYSTEIGDYNPEIFKFKILS